MSLHKSLAIGDIHIPYQWSYADSTARGAATGFVASDVGKLARQLDNNSLWMLSNHSPITWRSIAEGGTPAAHASTHNVGGGDTLAIDAASGTGSLRTLGTSATSACAGNDARLSDNRTDSNAIHKATAAEISAITEKTVPISADVLLIEDSADSYAKKRLTIGNFPGGLDATALHKATSAEISAMTEKTVPVSADLLVIEDSAASNAKKKVQIGNFPCSVFGRDYQAAASDSRVTTTSDVFQTKTTLTTSALTGTYRIGWTAVIDLSTISAANVEAQLYNDTDASIVGALIVWRGTINQERACVGGFAEIVFTGAAKTFYIQYRSVNGTITAAIAAAKIELWRVA